MSTLFKNFKMDEKKEFEGVWVEPAPANPDGTVPRFLIARISSNNQKFKKAMERETKPYQRLIQLNTLSNEKADQIRLTVFVNSILLHWENVFDENDQPLSFSKENALELLKKLPDLWAELETNANNASLFRIEEQEVIAKN